MPSPVQTTDEFIHGLGDVLSAEEIRSRARQIDYQSLSQHLEAEAIDKVRAAKPKKASAVLLRASNITIKPITWLWDQWLPQGKLTILGGAGGTGKTTLALALASAITTGGRFPDGSICKAIGNALVWSSEDDPDDVIVPRLIAMGADLSRIYFACAIDEDGKKRAFDPSTDIPLLTEKVLEMDGASLLIIDPIVSAVAKDMNQANAVRRSLQPIVDFALANQCAVLGISHLGKGTQGKDPTERILGSQAFTAFARMVWLTACNKETGERVLVRSKSNISRLDGGFSYAVDQVQINGGISTSRVLWKGPVDGFATEILREYESIDDGDKSSELQDAEEYLRELLASEQLPTNDVKAQSKDAGFSWATIRRASQNLGIKSRKSSMDGGWYWGLRQEGQNPQDAQSMPKMLMQKSEHLRENMSTFTHSEAIAKPHTLVQPNACPDLEDLSGEVF